MVNKHFGKDVSPFKPSLVFYSTCKIIKLFLSHRVTEKEEGERLSLAAQSTSSNVSSLSYEKMTPQQKLISFSVLTSNSASETNILLSLLLMGLIVPTGVIFKWQFTVAFILELQLG